MVVFGGGGVGLFEMVEMGSGANGCESDSLVVFKWLWRQFVGSGGDGGKQVAMWMNGGNEKWRKYFENTVNGLNGGGAAMVVKLLYWWWW
ncbi:Hypothetical predicted protein [Olea europaea subsp. europaea]|uniref:Uncharacterized protein n=1 Tax=Olea europaea subsp. europaea TaxID=158383 RepID=A0A8S0U7D2_OLEEU|nr:Hypothetical predicted protein [Olea europaea subsp. europaea]